MGEERDRFLVDEMLRPTAVIGRVVRSGRYQAETDARDRYAIEHATELFLEAMKKVSERFREANPSTPWRSFLDLRRIIAHPYDEGAEPEAFDELWRFASADVPRIAQRLKRAKFPEAPDSPRE